MLDLDALRQRPDILARIDWDLGPQEAFETYQVKAAGGWRLGRLSAVYHFAIDCWQGQRRLLLIRRSLTSAEEVAELPVPADLVAACLQAQGGAEPAAGWYAIDAAIKEWLRQRLQP